MYAMTGRELLARVATTMDASSYQVKHQAARGEIARQSGCRVMRGLSYTPLENLCRYGSRARPNSKTTATVGSGVGRIKH